MDDETRCDNSNDCDTQHEIVTKFIDLLGSSSGQMHGSEGELRECLSSELEEEDVVCFLPSFRVMTEEEEESHNVDEKVPSVLWSSLEQGVRSILRMPMNDVSRDDSEDESRKEDDPSYERYTKGSIESAPLDLLRKLQEALRSYTHSRLTEWKILLQHHDSDEAIELAKYMKYHRMIVGCRGNTTMRVFGEVQDVVKDTLDSLSGSETSETEETSRSSVGKQPYTLACKLQAEFFVKLRHGSRTFGTSSFTLVFETQGIVRYSLSENDGKLTSILFECNENDMMESIQSKANALVLKAVAYQAADTVRWSRTFLSDLWESEHTICEEDSSFSDSVSAHSFNTFGTISTFISSRNGKSTRIASFSKAASRSPIQKKRLKYPRSKMCVPADIITRKEVKEKKTGLEGGNGWQQSVVFQIVAFLFLFALCLQFMAFKKFCHSLVQYEFHSSFFNAYKTALRGRGSIERSPKGVSFHRVISSFPEDSKFVLELQNSDTHCKVSDEFGVNDCHFNWKEQAEGNFSTAISTVLDESSSIEAHLIVEGHIPYKLSCALCGQPCEIGLPIINFKYTFRMPDCPVDLRNHFQDFQYQLWSHSPTDGVVSVSLEGTAIVYSSPEEKLAEFQVEGTIR
ncbi:hypothetical protein IV203_031125 [Nitzschia inconspicua]|uniref:Uncharacterized protein n=1 Tax=Nitzschia inconspicua TaxID=303405 RepID=A0A9K3Q229_9STRA|nr:hypothetical protein IV203_031125 [Nitzschia inconspicua]